MSIAAIAAGFSNYLPAITAGAEGFLNYRSAKDSSKAQSAWQAYSNSMIELSGAEAQNAITMNEIFAGEESTQEAEDIQIASLRAQGAATVAAATAGVKGVSVRQAKYDLYRSASVAEGRRALSLSNRMLSFDQQRRTTALSTAMQKDYSFIPKPSASSYLLGTATKINKLYPTVEAPVKPPKG